MRHVALVQLRNDAGHGRIPVQRVRKVLLLALLQVAGVLEGLVQPPLVEHVADQLDAQLHRVRLGGDLALQHLVDLLRRERVAAHQTHAQTDDRLVLHALRLGQVAPVVQRGRPRQLRIVGGGGQQQAAGVDQQVRLLGVQLQGALVTGDRFVRPLEALVALAGEPVRLGGVVFDGQVGGDVVQGGVVFTDAGVQFGDRVAAEVFLCWNGET